MTGFKRTTEFQPAWDKRDPDPAKNYGISSVDLLMTLAGEKGAVTFHLMTNWHLPEVTEEFKAKPILGPLDIKVRFLPGPSDQALYGPPSKWTRVLKDGLHYTKDIAGRHFADQLEWYGKASDENSRRADERMAGNALVSKVGKKNSGRILDARTWDEMPEVANV